MTARSALDADEAVLGTAQGDVGEDEERTVAVMLPVERLDAIRDAPADLLLRADGEGGMMHERRDDPVDKLCLLGRHRAAEFVRHLQLAEEGTLRLILAEMIILCFHITMFLN